MDVKNRKPLDISDFGVCCLLLVALLCAAIGAETAASATIQVVDAAGRSVKLHGPPRRIAVVGTAPFIPLHVLYMFPEAGKRLVGFEKRGKAEDTFLPLLDPAFGKKTVMSARPGPEQIASLEPDLVIARGSVPGAMEKSLSAIGIPVCLLALEDPDRFIADIRVLGTVLGMEDRASEIIAYYQSRLSVIDGVVGDLPEADRPGVLVLEYSRRGGETAVKVPGATWIQTLQVRRSGGRPVWLKGALQQSGWQMAGFEQIAAWHPDVINMVIWYELDACNVMKELAAHPNWRRLKAVETRRFHLFPTDIYGWDTPDPRWILGMLWTAATLHPDKFAGKIEMRAEVKAFFSRLYGLKNAEINAHIMPKILLDGCP